jgi:serine/threonine protein phosphatase PrpC
VSLHAVSHALTDVGRKRKKNEDSYLVNEALGLFIVAYWMGGHAGGDVASAEACDQVFAMVKRGAPALEAFRAAAGPEEAAAVRRVVESDKDQSDQSTSRAAAAHPPLVRALPQLRRAAAPVAGATP